jgi:hypothetical protein
MRVFNAVRESERYLHLCSMRIHICPEPQADVDRQVRWPSTSMFQVCTTQQRLRLPVDTAYV